MGCTVGVGLARLEEGPTGLPKIGLVLTLLAGGTDHQELLKFASLASEDFNAAGAKLPVAGGIYVFAGALKSGFRPNALSIYCAS